MSIEVRNISKTFGGMSVLRNVSLVAPGGKLTALLGPSGSGKTTLLRIIAGLEEADEGGGAILFEGEDVAQRAVRERGVGFVFQHYALFKHMTVFENIAFGLRVRRRAERPTREEIRRRVEGLLELVQLEGYGTRHPGQLSGGQRQRVALARALAVEPRVLLLDEPFGALDAKVRQELRRWLRRLHDEMRLTTIFVTHDQDEAMEVADRVVVMNNATIEQEGSPEHVFHNPASEFVMNFIGQVNVFHRRLGRPTSAAEAVEFQCADELPAGTKPARVFVRPHEVDVASNGGGGLRGRVLHVNAAGAQVKLEVMTELGEMVFAEIPQEQFRALRPEKGATVFVAPRRARVFIEDEQTGQVVEARNLPGSTPGASGAGPRPGR